MNIKQYSSPFATKLNYIFDLSEKPQLQKGRIRSICEVTSEPESTINNWLFNGKIPREAKKLAISDHIGVSYDYLFDEKIDTVEISKPELHYVNNLYSLPFVEASKINNFSCAKIFPIKERVELSFPFFNELIEKYKKNIYLTCAPVLQP